MDNLAQRIGNNLIQSFIYKEVNVNQRNAIIPFIMGNNITYQELGDTLQLNPNQIARSINNNQLDKGKHPVMSDEKKRKIAFIVYWLHNYLDFHSKNPRYHSTKAYLIDNLNNIYKSVYDKNVSERLLNKILKIIHVRKKSIYDLFSCDECNPKFLSNLNKLLDLLFLDSKIIFLLSLKEIKVKLPKGVINLIFHPLIYFNANEKKKHLLLKNKIFLEELHSPIRRRNSRLGSSICV
jgi:hypothetical protein